MSEPPIIIDTREKKPYSFPNVDSIIYEKLDVGDYTRDGFRDVFAIERKTLNDLANSVGNERDRFRSEIERAQSLSEFVVLIEAPRVSVEAYSGNGVGGCPSYYSNIAANSVLGTIDNWPTDYEILRFEWAGDRQNAMHRTLQLLDKWYIKYQ